jgi:hypothetical protein
VRVHHTAYVPHDNATSVCHISLPHINLPRQFAYMLSVSACVAVLPLLRTVPQALTLSKQSSCFLQRLVHRMLTAMRQALEQRSPVEVSELRHQAQPGLTFVKQARLSAGRRQCSWHAAGCKA